MTWLLIIFNVVFLFILLTFLLVFIILIILSRLRFLFSGFLLGILFLGDFLHFYILIRLSDCLGSNFWLFGLLIGSFFRLFRFWFRSDIWFDDWLWFFFIWNRLVRFLLSLLLKTIKSFFFFFINCLNASFYLLDGSNFFLFRFGSRFLSWFCGLCFLRRFLSLWFLYRSLWWCRQLKISFCFLVSFLISISLSMVSFLLIIRHAFPFNTHFLEVISLT